MEGRKGQKEGRPGGHGARRPGRQEARGPGGQGAGGQGVKAPGGHEARGPGCQGASQLGHQNASKTCTLSQKVGRKRVPLGRKSTSKP